MKEENNRKLGVAEHELTAWPRIAAISAMISFSLPTFMTGLELQKALTVHDAMLALVIGSVLLVIVGGVMGSIGVKSRLSSYLLVKIAFGEKGASIVNLAFAISLLGWFGVNLDLFSDTVVQLLANFSLSTPPTWLIEVIAGLLMITTTLYGFKAINILASVLIPIMVYVTFLMLFSAQEVMTFEHFLTIEKSAQLTLGQGVASVVGVIIIGAIILPDITRFSKQASGGWHVAFWSYGVAQLFVLLVTIYAASTNNFNDTLELMLSLNLGIFSFFLIIAGCWVLNSLNLYSMSLSLEATFPKVNPNLHIIVLGAVGIIAAFLNILDNFLSFLSILSVIFIPVAGVIIVDFIFINRDKYHLTGLQNAKSDSPAALIAWFIGASLAIFNEYIGGVSATGIPVIDAIFITAISYVALYKLVYNKQDNHQLG